MRLRILRIGHGEKCDEAAGAADRRKNVIRSRELAGVILGNKLRRGGATVRCAGAGIAKIDLPSGRSRGDKIRCRRTERNVAAVETDGGRAAVGVARSAV